MINIQTNSKLIKNGDTFVAIKGKTVDGHQYVEEAINNGAKKVIVSNGKKYAVETINVTDTNEYLTNLLVEKYADKFNSDLKIVGITGTNGKTTTGFMAYEKLKFLGIKVCYIGTIGFYYDDIFEKTLNTTPDILSLYKCLDKAIEHQCKIVLLEASSIGIIEKRIAGIKFDIGVFTNLTHDHLDYHHTMHEYMLAKKEMFNNLKDNGIAIINADDKYSQNFMTSNTLTYGFEKSDIKCVKHSKAFDEFTFKFKNNKYQLNSPLFGKYNVSNVMAVIGILYSLGIEINDIIKDFNLLNPPNGRINILKFKNNKIIIDYAHTPDGLKQVLSSAKVMAKGKLYVVFGCPGDRDRLKRPMMSKIVNKYSNYFIFTNDDPHNEDENQIVNDALGKLKSSKYEIILDRKEAITKAFNLLKDNDILLILGKGHEDVIIKKNERIPHNDKKFVEELIKKNNI